MPYTVKESVNLASIIQGWMKPGELEWIATAASKVPAGGRWVEIGSWKGRSLVATCLAIPGGCKITSIDSFAGNAGSKVQGELALPVPWVEWQNELARRMIERLRPDVTLDFRKMSSMEAVKGEEQESSDVVFVDGEHAYEFTRDDINAWWPVLKKGGTMFGHDREHAGVAKAIRECLKTWERGSHSIWHKGKP